MMLSLLASKLGIYVMVFAAIAAGAFFWLRSHDAAVRAEMQASANQAIATQYAKDQAASIAALQTQAAQSAATNRRLQTIREATHAAAPSSSCAASPAVRALVGGLRNPTNGARATR